MNFVIPCNLKKYKLVDAFENLTEIDWQQTMAIMLAVTFIISFIVALITFGVEVLRDKLKGFVFA